MSSFEVETVATAPIEGQKTGTSGLRKKVTVFQSPNYLNNWIQSLFNSLPENELKGSTLVLGGDGRFWNSEAIQIIIKMAAANGVRKLLVGQNGVLSTPAVSATIRGRKSYGGIILTASHNPGGPDADFGIKYNTSNGGPAPESLTDQIYKHTIAIKEYKIAKLPNVDLSKIGVNEYGSFTVEVIDSVQDYLNLLQQVFDFASIKKLFARSDFKFTFDALSGVTGPYAQRIFRDEFGAAPDALINCVPKPDFGGHHPDPNLTYAADLAKKLLETDQYDFGAASDGDGDRNMVLGKRFFVTPSDSVAVIAAYAQQAIPYFSNGLKALSRSMPTGCALEKVAKKLGVDFYEVPTGWKFFGNIMDHYAKQGTPNSVICGEESFGTGSDHIREKDGLWAITTWLQILAYKNQSTPIGGFVGVGDIVREHWVTFGRNYFSRYDYEEVSSKDAARMMEHLAQVQKTLTKGSKLPNTDFTVELADDFEYRDPFDGSVSAHQGLRFIFSDGSRIIFRISGTSATGATIRLYVEKYEQASEKLNLDTQEVIKPLIDAALQLSKLTEFTGRTTPTVIT